MMNASESWPAPPRHATLGAKEVHLWRASLEQPAAVVERLSPLLSPDEHKRAARFHFEKDRRHFIVARAVLRKLLGVYLERSPAEIHFGYAAYGKPQVADQSLEQIARLHFNLAHSGSLAVYAFTRLGEVGVDLEQINPELTGEDIARRFFSASEVAGLDALAAGERALAFFNCWTRKEAFIKAKGMGLSLALDQFDVTLAPGQPASLLRTAWDEAEAARWSIRTLEIGAGYVGALALEAHDWEFNCWECEV